MTNTDRKQVLKLPTGRGHVIPGHVKGQLVCSCGTSGWRHFDSHFIREETEDPTVETISPEPHNWQAFETQRSDWMWNSAAFKTC